MTNISLPEFYDMLAHHDWWHEMSDDHRVSNAGREREGELRTIAKQSDRHQRLYDAYRAYARRQSDQEPNRPYFQLGWNIYIGDNNYTKMHQIKNREQARQLTEDLNYVYGAKTHWITEEWIEHDHN